MAVPVFSSEHVVVALAQSVLDDGLPSYMVQATYGPFKSFNEAQTWVDQVSPENKDLLTVWPLRRPR